MSAMIDFIRELQHTNGELEGEEMTAGEVADVLWLMHIMSSAHQKQPAIAEPAVPLLQPLDEISVIPSVKQIIQQPQQDSKAGTTSKKVDIYSSEPFKRERPDHLDHKEAQRGIAIDMPDAPALKDALILGRALRPMRRRYPSRKTYVLNERATVNQIAETQKKAWVPVMVPAQERWFELALVIDEGASMLLWHQTILELRTFFERLGAFRDIRVWSLATDNGESVHLYAGMPSLGQERIEHKPEELLDPTERRLILVVTDCVSPAWYSGAAQNVLEIWGKKNLVTLLQMLSWRLWPSTALCISENVYISNTTPGIANTRLKIPEFQTPSSSGSNDVDILSMPFPVITLSEDSFEAWAHMVMGAENAKVAGVMFAKNFLALPSQPKKQSRDDKERVHQFFNAASPTACRLAQLLSVTSVTPPVVHIIRQTLLPVSKQEHVAEVLLGGLLELAPRDHSRMYPEDVTYKFSPEVKKILRDSLSIADASRVHKAVSEVCEKHLGITRNFLGVVVAPSSFTELTIHKANQHIAEILISEWREQGDNDAFLADLLAKQVKTGEIPVPVKSSPAEQKTGEILVPIEKQLADVRAELDRESRAIDLLALLPHLNGQRTAGMREALATMRGVASSKNYIRSLLECLPYVADEYKVEVIEETLESTRLIAQEKERVEALDELLQGLPESWKAEVVQQTLMMTRNMTDNALRTSTLHTLLEHSPQSLKYIINRETVANRNIGSTQTTDKKLLNKKFRNKPSRTRLTCPSCFYENYTGDCRILSGIGEHRVLKAAPRSPQQKDDARKKPESLDTPFYTRELACRECTACGYLVPREIEQFPSLTLAIVGDIFSGKSHYITALLHQLREEWIKRTQSFSRFLCLTPNVEAPYLQNYERMFMKNLALQATIPTKIGQTANPLIYNLSIGVPPQEPPTTINLLLYDISGEDYRRERLVRVAPFVLNADAFIFVADPIKMGPVFEQLPKSLQTSIRDTLREQGGDLTTIREQPDGFNDTLALYERFHKQKNASSLPDTPIAVMVSKSDLIKYLPDAKSYSFSVNPQYGGNIHLGDISIIDGEIEEFLRKRGQGALLATTRILGRVQFFATSATGTPPDQQGHFKHVEPRRCLDPVLWILYQLGIITGTV